MSEDKRNASAKNWQDVKRGLRKEVINFRYESMIKASDLSKCLVVIDDVHGLRPDQQTDYLRVDLNSTEYWVHLGHAITPIDYYIELLLKQMLMGETSRCTIDTKSGQNIQFQLKMIRIESDGHYYAQPLPDLVGIVQRYKENGVKMFKNYPLFAHEYFGRAAKLLISCLPFETLAEREQDVTDASPAFLRELLETIDMNLAACLIKEKRFDDALHVLEFTDREENVPDKAIYRRATAHYHLNQFDEAKTMLERINYTDNRECNALYRNVYEKWKSSNEKYTDMVKKMFS